MRNKATTGTYEHETDDGRHWALEYTAEPYHPGTYWDPPEGGYCIIEGDVVEVRYEDEPGPPQKLDLDAWRALYNIDDKAFADIEQAASEVHADNDCYEED